MIQVVAVLVINQFGELLLAERLVKTFKGLYDTPGGKANVGENLLVAAQRELKEEALMVVPPERFEYWGKGRYHSEQGDPFDVNYWVVYMRDDIVGHGEPHKHGPWEWWARQRVERNPLLLMPSLRPPGHIEKYIKGPWEIVLQNGSKIVVPTDAGVRGDVLSTDPEGKNIQYVEYCSTCNSYGGDHTENCHEGKMAELRVCMSCQSTAHKDTCKTVECTYTPQDRGKSPIKIPILLCKPCQDKYLTGAEGC